MIKYLITFWRGLLIVGSMVLGFGVICCLFFAPIITFSSSDFEYKWVFYILTYLDVLILVYLIYKVGEGWIDK